MRGRSFVLSFIRVALKQADCQGSYGEIIGSLRRRKIDMKVAGIRRALIWGITGAAIGGAGVAVVRVVEKSSRVILQADEPQLSPFPALPAEMRERLILLLEKRELPCEKEMKKPQYAQAQIAVGDGQSAEVVYQTGLPDWQQLSNCHAAAFWVVSGLAGKAAAVASMFPEKISDLLAEEGFTSFKIELSGDNRFKVDPVLVLKPGDLLLFAQRWARSSGQSELAYLHSMVYLGGTEGKHFVFQKSGMGCGEKATFNIDELNQALDGYRIRWLPAGAVMVIRK